MKKLLLMLVLALPLGACATVQTDWQALTLVTKSIANPVTKTQEAQVELALDTAVQGLLAYRRACIAGTADTHCRANIAQIQAYTRQVPVLVAQLRTFVDNNDQVNASVIYNQLVALYNNVKASAAQLGVSLGASA
jgi:hypothetical protein